MEALNSTVEPLALNYLSYGFLAAVNKMLAACVAAVTAAFGFWRFGRNSSHPRPEQRCRRTDAASPPCAPPGPSAELAAADDPPALLVPDGINCIPPILEAESISPKGKFVLYYRDDDDFREGGVEDDGGAAAALEDEKSRRWMDMDFERKMEIRMADMGWYRCQDLAVLNGSVVRLWDGCCRVRAAA